MKTYRQIIEGMIIPIHQHLLKRTIRHFVHNLTNMGHTYKATVEGSKKRYIWRKGRDHFEILHDDKVPGIIKVAHGRIGDNGQVQVSSSRVEPLLKYYRQVTGLHKEHK